MNKKGFTLVELLVVISIMAIMTLIAIPNITRLVNRGKNEQMKSDAKELISKAKYQYKMNETTTEFEMDDLWDEDRYDGYGDKYTDVSIKLDNKVWKVNIKTGNHCLSTSSDGQCGEINEDDIDSSYVVER